MPPNPALNYVHRSNTNQQLFWYHVLIWLVPAVVFGAIGITLGETLVRSQSGQLYFPMIFALLLTGVMYAVVRWGHCRDPFVAGGIAVVAGLLMSLGSLELCFIRDFGLTTASRIDLLPKYIAFRAQHDRWVRVNSRTNEEKQLPPEESRWHTTVSLVGTVAFSVIGPLLLGLWQSLRPYDNRTGAWMHQFCLRRMPTEAFQPLLQLLDADDLSGVQEWARWASSSPTERLQAWIIIDYARGDYQGNGPIGYLTMATWTTSYCQGRYLSEDELRAVAALSPGLRYVLGMPV